MRRSRLQQLKGRNSFNMIPKSGKSGFVGTMGWSRSLHRMLLPGLLLDAVGNITSLLFSVPFSGFQYHVGFSTRSHLSVIAPFLKAVSGICQKNCINTHPLVSFAYLPTASRFVYQLQTERLSGKGPFPSLAPQSGTVSQLTFAPQILLLHSDRLLKHTFERVTSYPTKSSHCSVLHSHHPLQT